MGISIPLKSEPNMNTQVIIFDFDGTIADTQDAVIGITNRLAPEFGFPPLSQEEIAHYKALTAREIIKQSRVSLWKLPFLVRRVKRELREEIKTIRPIPGIEDALERLKIENCYLGIITSNSEENASQFLRQHGLLHYFNFVQTSSHLFGKDKIIKRLLREKNIAPELVTYIGDETRDIEAARKSGVRIIAVSWGFNDGSALAKCQPDALIAHPSELPVIISVPCKAN